MRGWSTLALVVAALGLGAYIYFVELERSDTEVKEKVYTLEADALEEIRVVAKGETTLLRKTDGAWKMVEPIATDVDENQVTAMVNSLTSLEITREVEPNATNLAEFGLAEPKVDLTFKAKNGVSGRLRLGDQTPTAGDMYALKGDETRVFLVGSYVESSLAHSAFELRDKRVLRFERDKADGLAITTAAGTTTLSRSESNWRVTAPASGRGDYGAIEGLLTKLSTTMMSEIASPTTGDLKQYGLDKPVATVAVKAGSSTATLAVSAAKDGKTYAKDAARDMVFVVDSTFGTDLQKGVDEYRRKEVFDFRAFSATALTLVRGAQTVQLQKIKGTGENAAEKWQVTVTGEGAAPARDAVDTDVSSLLDKLVALRALTFPNAVPAGNTPALKVSVTFEESKKEEASFAHAGEKAYASRADESGALEVQNDSFAQVLGALDTVLKPPAPATTPAPASGDAAGSGATPEKKP